MDKSAGEGDDISGLWGTELSTGMEPAPREPKPAAHVDEENGQGARLVAIEQDIRNLLELIQRVESQVNLRLDRVEEQVIQVTDQLDSARPQSDASSRRKGMARIAEVLKPAKEWPKEGTRRP
jgi:hypothetical protein